MVSRRKILSRSRDDLNLEQSYIQQEAEEDVWYQKEKLFKVIIYIEKDHWQRLKNLNILFYFHFIYGTFYLYCPFLSKE
jgi:hypothetical protein